MSPPASSPSAEWSSITQLPFTVCLAFAGFRKLANILLRALGKFDFVFGRLGRWCVRIHLPDGQRLVIRPFSNDPMIVKEIYISKGYERFFSPAEGQQIVDVGAQVGVFTVKAAKLIGPRGKLIAFEPEPENFRLLSLNVRMNGLDHVDMFRIALSSSRGRKPFRVSLAGATGAHTLEFRKSATQRRPLRAMIVDVDCETLDSFIAERSVSSLDLLKIDVERHELEVLGGATGTIQRFHPKIVVERQPRDAAPDAVREYLLDRGYETLVSEDLPWIVHAIPGDAGQP